MTVGFKLVPAEVAGRIGEVGGLKVGNCDIIAIVAGFIDVTPLMSGVDLVIVVVGGAVTIGELGALVGGFIMTGVGFIATGVGFIMTGVGFIMTGVGFIMTGVGFIMTGVGFIMGPMAGIPDPMDSRSLPSSVSTEIDAFRRVLRAIILRWFCA